MRANMNDSNNCDNCRFRECNNYPCNKCSTKLCVDPFTHKESFSMPSEWMPLTDAQILERNRNEIWRVEGILKGSLKAGYTYEKSGKEYNKMYKEKTIRQKALGRVKNVVFNPPYTIVIWEDRTKTIVKCENELYDPEKGLAMAMAKRLFGNHGCYYEVFKKWLPKEKPTLPEIKSVPVIDLPPKARTRTYSVKELAEALGVSEDTVRRDIKKGAYPTAKKENGKWVIPDTCIM